MELHSVKEPKRRPKWPGECRRWLAREAKALIESCCARAGVVLKPRELREAVAAVFHEAGAGHPNPKQDPTKFDRMMATTPCDPVQEARERGETFEKKRGDIPI